MSIKVIELFAGVGGFRLGLQQAASEYKVVWSNQWEPSTRIQHASRVYEARWPEASHSNENIAEVTTDRIPDHDLLVGGFPCQDYSVASTLRNSGGLIGKKGVLWWQIHRILQEKGDNAPDYLMLENVDRLLKSPADQRGRDFAIMLSSLNRLGYAVEWRVINAADYGMPQRRRRIFILGYRRGSSVYQQWAASACKMKWFTDEGTFAKAFPARSASDPEEVEISDDLVHLSKFFNKGKEINLFQNSGLMMDGQCITFKIEPDHTGLSKTLGDVVLPLKEVPEAFIIHEDELAKWQYLKGSKKERKFNKAGGYWYNYAEGGMVFPDPLDRPSRTIITGEGGKSASRFKHVIIQNGSYRRLTPVELERLNMFPENHTLVEGITDAKRAFFMGNALVVGIVERLGKELIQQINGRI